MKTATWETLEIFEKPINGKNIGFVDSPLEVPEGVDKAVRESWDIQLKWKQAQLQAQGTETEIKPYHEGPSDEPLNALYEGDNAKMWPGPVVSLKDIRHTDGGIELIVGQTSFPFIAALKEEGVSGLYTEQGITKPRPALAICTYALTNDGQLALTVRGPKTNMYPGRLYGQGGNPLTTDTNIMVHQISEMADEIVVGESCYDGGDFEFGGLVVDREALPGKPDLIGWIPVDLSAQDIREGVRAIAIPNRPNDSIGVVFAPTDPQGLFDYLTRRTHPVQYCPPANAGLVLYGKHTHGEDWAQAALETFE